MNRKRKLKEAGKKVARCIIDWQFFNPIVIDTVLAWLLNLSSERTLLIENIIIVYRFNSIINSYINSLV